MGVIGWEDGGEGGYRFGVEELTGLDGGFGDGGDCSCIGWEIEGEGEGEGEGGEEKGSEETHFWCIGVDLQLGSSRGPEIYSSAAVQGWWRYRAGGGAWADAG